MVDPAKRRATYQDIIDAPADKRAEIVDGELVLSPRPSVQHTAATSLLGAEITFPFGHGRGGPGGWIIILHEPELHLGADVVIPDLAGWRRERMPQLPRGLGIELPPDWLCEAISPSTERHDRGGKLRIYARVGVKHVWFLNPNSRVLEVLRLEGPRYTIVEVFEGDARVRAEPFDAIELDLAVLWADVAPAPPEP